MRTVLRITAAVLVTIVLLCLIVAAFLGFRLPAGAGSKPPPQGKHLLPWVAVLNRSQTLNSCGPYCTRVFLYEKTGSIVDPELVNREMPFRTPAITYPWGITRYLRKNGIIAHIYCFIASTPDRYVRWIKKRIDKNEPVIITVNRNNHYITIVGYDADTAFVYDPAWFGNNGALPGNRKMGFNDPVIAASPLKIAVACAGGNKKR